METNINAILENENPFIRLDETINGGIPSDLIVESYKSFGEELTCSICIHIVLEPVMCSECENLFCKTCINDLRKSSNKCPNRCIFREKELGLMLKKLLSKVEFHCYFFKSGCNAITNYEDFIKHFRICSYATYRCIEDDCNFQGYKHEVIEHHETCPFRRVRCEFCELVFPLGVYREHNENCGNSLVNCVDCKKEIVLKDLKAHNVICPEKTFCCKICESELKNKDKNEHTELICLKKMIEKYKVEKKEMQSIIKYYENEDQNLGIPNFSNNNNNNSVDSFFGLDLNLNSQNYSIQGETIARLTGLNSLVYSIADLHSYKENWAICGNYCNLQIFNSVTMRSICSLTGHTNYIWTILHLSNYKISYVASGSQDNDIRIWDLDTFRCVKVLSGHTNWVTKLSSLEYNNRLIVSSSYDHKIKIWNIETEENVITLSNVYGKSLLNCIYYCTTYIAHGTTSNMILIYDIESRSNMFTMTGHNALINCFENLGAFKRSWIASGSDDKTIIIWDLLDQCRVAALEGHIGVITSLCHLKKFDRDVLASCSDDYTIRLWSLSGKNCITTLRIHSSWVKCVINLSNKPDHIISHGDSTSLVLTKLIKN